MAISANGMFVNEWSALDTALFQILKSVFQVQLQASCLYASSIHVSKSCRATKHDAIKETKQNLG